MVEQGDQVGIVALVEDDEPDIDRLAAARSRSWARRIDRAGMAAEPALALVDHDIVLAAEQPRRAKTRNAGADDSNFHPCDPRYRLLGLRYAGCGRVDHGSAGLRPAHGLHFPDRARLARLMSARDARGPEEHERRRPALPAKTSDSLGATASRGTAGRR
jgi:hypothetical protein